MTDNITRSLTLAKLQRPRAGRGLVARTRLVEQLNSPHSLTFILAPAGYGKTTLLSTWLETCRVPNAWVSLDEHDNDLAVFVTALAEALHSVLPAVDDTLTVLNGMTLPSPEALTRTLLSDLNAVQQDFILVLDDYHVIHQQAIHDLIFELVSHLPHAMHLVLASRYDPPLPLARLRAQNNVVELRTAELRLTVDEAVLFLRDVMALSLDEQSIALLVTKTEGWPVGLRLAALSLRRETQTQNAAEVFANNRYVMDYLLAEVLAQLPIAVQEFLVKTSFLDQLSAPLCAAVTGLTDRLSNGELILDWLDHADLFVVPVGEPRHWYRCHHLFRQLLISRLHELQGPAEIAALRLRASAWFAANGYLDEALHHVLAAGDTDAAVQIIAQHRHELMNQAHWQHLERWLHLFPRETIDEHPHLLLIEVWLKFIHQQLREVAALLDRAEALLAGLSSEMIEPLQGEIASRRAAVLYWSGDFARSLALAQSALDKIPLKWWYVRGYTRLFLSGAHLASGDLTQAHATLEATDEPDQGLGYQNFLLGATGFIHWMAADLSGLVQTARQVVANSAPTDRSEMVTFSQHHLGLYHYQRNDLLAAEKYLLPLVMRPYAVHAACFLNSAVLLARIRQTQGQPEEAQKIADLMLSFALETRSEVVLFSARAFQAELALRQGRVREAGQWAEQYGLFRRVPWPFAFVPPLVLALILLTQDTPASRQQARQLLAQMAEYFTSIHYTVIRIQILALQAMLYRAEGDEQQALAALEKSIGLAEPGGFLRLFVDLSPPLKPLLQKLTQRGVSPAYIGEILAVFDSDDVVSSAGRLETGAPVSLLQRTVPLTRRERDVLLLLDKRYTDKEIADTLSISVETVYTHVRHLSDKLDARGRRAIVQAAKAQGLLL